MPVSQYRPDNTKAQADYSLKEIDKGLKVETAALHPGPRTDVSDSADGFSQAPCPLGPACSDSCFMMVLGKSDPFCPGDQQLLLKVE